MKQKLCVLFIYCLFVAQSNTYANVPPSNERKPFEKIFFEYGYKSGDDAILECEKQFNRDIELPVKFPLYVGAAPEYAKWGPIAVKETQIRYNADIIDYKHVGRVVLTPNKSEEKFKLWLRSKEGNEFGVYVFIRFDPTTDKIQTIRFFESDR